MNGPEHYREAERLLAASMSRELPEEDMTASMMVSLAAAQVHATLALAAATVGQAASRGPGDVDPTWTKAVWS